MRYLILVPDGAADNPGEGESGKTPLEEAHMPVVNGLAARGLTGLVRTIPEGKRPAAMRRISLLWVTTLRRT